MAPSISFGPAVLRCWVQPLSCIWRWTTNCV